MEIRIRTIEHFRAYGRPDPDWWGQPRLAPVRDLSRHLRLSALEYADAGRCGEAACEFIRSAATNPFYEGLAVDMARLALRAWREGRRHAAEALKTMRTLQGRC